MTTIDQWWEAGERVIVHVGGEDRTIFLRRLGYGPSMTMLHGFPSSSHDWARVAVMLRDRYELLLPDFLGFGASDKPAGHTYTLHEQADVIEALWSRLGIDETILVAHDYGVSVAQELLARRAEGSIAADVRAVTFMNGGLYPDLHRPEPAQATLLDPVQGPQLSASITEELLEAVLSPTFASADGASEHGPAIWTAINHGTPVPILDRLIRYMPDRVAHAGRWTGALEQTDVPLAFAWGMLDPISGAHMAERIRERLPDAPIAMFEDVGHWPPLEAPDRVAAAIRTG
jgi:pimeloyl-ACP methyl ester carboxylesterase